jgi:hypothetical protein
MRISNSLALLINALQLFGNPANICLPDYTPYYPRRLESSDKPF